MVEDDWRKWQLANALQITCVSVQRGSGFSQITHLGGKLPNGSRWSTTVESVIEAIEAGVRYYMDTGAESQIVTVARDENAKRFLSVGLTGNWQPLLRLPRCPD
jgi:hypothetical protein